MRLDNENPFPYAIANIIVIILAIPTLVISIIGFSSFSLSGRFASDLVSNWKQKLILDIVERNFSCPEGYTDLNLDSWSGTVDGCDCTGIWSSRIPWNARNKLNRYSCSYNMTWGGCRDIRPNSKVPYHTWRGQALCTKLAEKPYEAYLKEAVPVNLICPNGTKPCGLLDTTLNKVCAKNEEECPINKIAILQQPPGDEYKYKIIQLADGVKLYTTKQAVNNTVIVNFKVSEGLVCLDPIQKNTMVNQYILDVDYDNYKCTTTFNDILYDYRYTIHDRISKKMLYQDNGIMPIIYSLPYYPFALLESTVELYNRPFLGWKSECIGNSEFTIDRLKSAYVLLDGIYTYKLVLMIFVIILFVFIVGSVGPKLKAGDSIALENLLDIAFILLNIIAIIFSTVCYNQFNGYSFKNFNCGDSITNAFVSAFSDAIASNRGYDLTITIIIIFNIAVFPGILLVQKLFSGCGNCFIQKMGNEITPAPYQPYYQTQPEPTYPSSTYPPITVINQPLTADPTNPGNMMYVCNPRDT